MFGCCFHLSLCHSCGIGISENIWPFTHNLQLPYILQCTRPNSSFSILFCFHISIFRRLCFFCCERFAACKICTQTPYSWELKLNFGTQRCMITFGILSLHTIFCHFYFSECVWCLHTNKAHDTDYYGNYGFNATGKFAVYSFFFFARAKLISVHCACNE